MCSFNVPKSQFNVHLSNILLENYSIQTLYTHISDEDDGNEDDESEDDENQG